MNIYDRYILPPLLDFAMRQNQLAAYRHAVVPAAQGRVLEIGIGSGLNLSFYGENVVLTGLDPSERLLAKARWRAAATGVKVDLLQASAMAIPLEDAAFDAVVMTWSLCSIPDPLAALSEMRRVLKPGGTLFFVEHGLSPEPSVAKWQQRLTPLWSHIAGGCHLDRKIDDLLRGAGFIIAELHKDYAQGPRPMTFMYEGRARAPDLLPAWHE